MDLYVDLEGVPELVNNLAIAHGKIAAATPQALYLEGEAIMTLSKETFVPVDLGILRSTGYVRMVPETDGLGAQVELGYGGAAAPYAVAVHENPRAGRTGGVTPSGTHRKTWATVGQWKYLEQPFLAAAGGILERLGIRIRSLAGWT